jgi:hypothetical protein
LTTMPKVGVPVRCLLIAIAISFATPAFWGAA